MGEKNDTQHVIKYFQKHKSEESLLQDPEGTGFVNNTTLNFRTAIPEAKKMLEPYLKILRGDYFHPEFHDQTVMQV